MPYLKLAPRRDIKQPDIALLWSALNNQLLPRPVPYCFDLGRGDLQFIGYSSIYCEREPASPTAWRRTTRCCGTPGTWIMDPRDGGAASRRTSRPAARSWRSRRPAGTRYTRAGCLADRDLTGFKVREVRPMDGSL